MANTINWGQAAVDNTIDYGQGASDNTISWGKSQTLSPSGETNITGSGGTPSFTNTLSTLFDGVDDKTTITQVSRNGVFTFSFWFKFTGSFNTNTESFVWGCHNNNSSYLGMSTASIVRLKLNGALFTIVESGGNNIPQNTWAQFTLVRNSSNSVQLYLNGATFGSAIASGNSLTFSSFGRIINLSFGFKGNIDSAALWFSDETSNVATIYNSGLPSDLSALASAPRNWWRMGDGSTYPTINDNIGSLPMTMLNMSATNFVTDVPT